MYTVVSIQKTVHTYVHSCTCKYIPVVHTRTQCAYYKQKKSEITNVT